jgi:hypothetical protein
MHEMVFSGSPFSEVIFSNVTGCEEIFIPKNNSTINHNAAFPVGCLMGVILCFIARVTGISWLCCNLCIDRVTPVVPAMSYSGC